MQNPYADIPMYAGGTPGFYDRPKNAPVPASQIASTNWWGANAGSPVSRPGFVSNDFRDTSGSSGNLGSLYQQAQMPGKSGGAPMYGGGHVGPAPRGRVESPGMFSSGLLGNIGMPQQYQSFNPYGSPSARMFDQYMQQAMQRYGGPGGFFGFSGYQFPQAAAPVAQQPATPPVGSTPWQQQNSWWGNNVGGGN